MFRIDCEFQKKFKSIHIPKQPIDYVTFISILFVCFVLFCLETGFLWVAGVSLIIHNFSVSPGKSSWDLTQKDLSVIVIPSPVPHWLINLNYLTSHWSHCLCVSSGLLEMCQPHCFLRAMFLSHSCPHSYSAQFCIPPLLKNPS